jgi:hypothetical protein
MSPTATLAARSMDAITRRAVRRMCEGKDTETIHRIHAKARALREHRAAMAFLSVLRRPVPVSATAFQTQDNTRAA